MFVIAFTAAVVAVSADALFGCPRGFCAGDEPKAADVKKAKQNFGPANAPKTADGAKAHEGPVPVDEPKAADVKKVKERFVKSGRDYYDSKNYEPAIKEWEEALSYDPTDRQVQEYIKNAKERLAKEAKKAKDVQVINVAAPPKEPGRALSLEDCIQIAIENHYPLKVAQEDVKLGRMRLWEARRNLLPTVNIRWQESEGRVNDRLYVGRKQSIDGSQAIFHGGEFFFIMKQAETNLAITEEEQNRIKNEVMQQIRKDYYSIGKARENLKMQTELRKEVDAIFDRVSKGHDSGVISMIEFLNVSSQTNQVSFQLASAVGDLKLAELIMKQAMSVDSDFDLAIEPNLEFKKIDINRDTVLREAYINRPEMKIHSMMIKYYDYERSLAKSKGWPKIDLMGSWGLAKEEYASQDQNGDPDRKMEQEWYLGFKASVPFWGSTAEYSYTREQWQPVVSAYQGTEVLTNAVRVGIWDNFRYYSGKQEAVISHGRAVQEFLKIKQDIEMEVEESCFSYEKALLQLETATRKVRYQERDLELTKFKRGLDEIPDSGVIDSMIKFAQERFGFVQALTDCHISIANINKAIGVADYYKDEPPAASGTPAPGPTK